MKTLFSHLNNSLNGTSFLRLLRVAFFLSISLMLVYGYYLHTEGQLLTVFKRIYESHLLPILKVHGLAIGVILAVFGLGFWFGRRRRGTVYHQPEKTRKPPVRKKQRSSRK
ncbi:hypothetical protein [Niallia taxi]|uniref:hypothetical protein n=1 Tax=Niallia taxi TaxID=2499688 RepID=UPI0015F4E076|nr:hypothetical protein [Niallia taxi]